MVTASQPAQVELRTAPPKSIARTEYATVLVFSIACSLGAFLHYYFRGQILLYGDAVAHLNIARRVIDSRTPGPLQLGTVWLPLPHLLMLPFVWSTRLWQNGIAGSIPSMLAYVAGVVGIFRLVRSGLEAIGIGGLTRRIAVLFVTVAYALNPNLLYLQSTAMTEPLYLALFIWATVYFSDFVFALRRGEDGFARRSLVRCGLLLAGCALTRYDGWYASAFFAVAGVGAFVAETRKRHMRPIALFICKPWRHAFFVFPLLIVFTPLIWFTYNYAVFGNALEFANGPYSAKGIMQRTMRPSDPHHPGWDSPRVATQYFVKAAILNVGGTGWQQRTWMWFALIGAGLMLMYMRPLWPWLLLWVPLPFYATSIAWGGVPIFLPEWWPFSYYNVRYGTQSFPLLFVFSAVALCGLVVKAGKRCPPVVGGIALLFLASSYIRAAQYTPICLREAVANSQTRIAFESKLAGELAQLPANATLLIYIGEHGGALQSIGMPLRRTINEGNHHDWENALQHPAEVADFVIAGENDPLASAVREHPNNLQLIATISSPGQAPARVYRSTER